MSKVLYGDRDCLVTYEYQEGNIFVHLEIVNWNKTVLKRLRHVFDLLSARLDQEGVPAFFASTESPKSKKLWALIRPWDELQEFKFGGQPVIWLGAWYTE